MNNMNTLSCDIPIGLASRLILTDDDLVQLTIDQLINTPEVREILFF